MTAAIVIAVDPGREKCGIAVVCRTGSVLWQGIVPAAEMCHTVERLATEHGAGCVVVGDRTGSLRACAALRETGPFGGRLAVTTVNEHKSTEEARARYWRANPPRGLWRLVPEGLRTPPRPVDDYVAVILAERYFKQESGDKNQAAQDRL